MAMTAGSTRVPRSAINVTPLIDVLLVLLIIFMVIQPTSQHGLDALAPQPPRHAELEPDPRTVVITVDGTASAPVYGVNGQDIAATDLSSALERIVQQTGDLPLFVRGTSALDYGSVAQVLALAHAAGAQNVGLLTPALLRQ